MGCGGGGLVVVGRRWVVCLVVELGGRACAADD